jgi:hypothetical protein
MHFFQLQVWCRIYTSWKGNVWSRNWWFEYLTKNVPYANILIEDNSLIMENKPDESYLRSVFPTPFGRKSSSVLHELLFCNIQWY